MILMIGLPLCSLFYLHICSCFYDVKLFCFFYISIISFISPFRHAGRPSLLPLAGPRPPAASSQPAAVPPCQHAFPLLWVLYLSFAFVFGFTLSALPSSIPVQLSLRGGPLRSQPGVPLWGTESGIWPGGAASCTEVSNGFGWEE